MFVYLGKSRLVFLPFWGVLWKDFGVQGVGSPSFLEKGGATNHSEDSGGVPTSKSSKAPQSPKSEIANRDSHTYADFPNQTAIQIRLPAFSAVKEAEEAVKEVGDSRDSASSRSSSLLWRERVQKEVSLLGETGETGGFWGAKNVKEDSSKEQEESWESWYRRVTPTLKVFDGSLEDETGTAVFHFRPNPGAARKPSLGSLVFVEEEGNRKEEVEREEKPKETESVKVKNQRVKVLSRYYLRGVNWYGASDVLHVVQGLDKRNLDDLCRDIKKMGFTAVRLPFSNQLLREHHRKPLTDEEGYFRGSDGPSSSDSSPSCSPGSRNIRVIDPEKNPDLIGKSALEILDEVILALGRAKLLVLLNNHTSYGSWYLYLNL